MGGWGGMGLSVVPNVLIVTTFDPKIRNFDLDVKTRDFELSLDN